jgi:aryl-alcohol dehydrogenase-like predicted oxidoreductase
VEKIREAQEMAGVEHFVSSQPQYSMVWRGPEQDVIPYSRDHGVSQIVWSPLAQGVLTGKYKPGEPLPEGTRATSDAMGGFMDRALDEVLLERVQRLRPVADGLGLSMAQLALAWLLREKNVASAIIGASRPEQVEDNAAASGVELDEATLASIDEILGDSVAWDPPASTRA